MKYTKAQAGKWVASANDKVVASDVTLTKLMLKVKKRKDSKTLMFSLVPKGFIAGSL